MISKDEQILVGVRIKVLRPVKLPSTYKTMFHGETNLTPGTYFWWFPVKNVSYARMVHEIERWYKGKIKIEYGMAGTAEI